MKERRKAPRTSSNVPLDIYDPKGQMIVGEGRFVDMSVRGARMESRKPLKAKASVRLHVVPSGKPVLELSGKVVWARKKTAGYEYGIRFSAPENTPLS